MSILDKDIRYIRTNNGISMEEKVFDELVYRIHQLEKENALLKYKKLEKQFPDLNAVAVEIDTYKSRCEKAIKLIKEAGCYDEDTKRFNDDIWDELDDLLNILQNGSVSNE